MKNFKFFSPLFGIQEIASNKKHGVGDQDVVKVTSGEISDMEYLLRNNFKPEFTADDLDIPIEEILFYEELLRMSDTD